MYKILNEKQNYTLTTTTALQARDLGQSHAESDGVKLV